MKLKVEEAMPARIIRNNIIDMNEEKKYAAVPYEVTRTVLKQDDLEAVAGYDRHKETR